MNIVLFLLNLGSFSSFHYSTKSGRNVVFQWNEAKQRHEYELPYEEWSADEFRFAKDLLDQMLPVPILYDIAPAKVEEILEQVTPAPENFIDAEPVEPETVSFEDTLDGGQEVESVGREALPPVAPSKPKRSRKPSLVLPGVMKDLEDPLEAAALA